MMILLFSVCLMFVYSWKLALITLLSAPLFLVIFYSFNKLNRKYQRHIMESSADLEAQLVESLNSISTIKRFGIEEYANLKTETRFVHLLKTLSAVPMVPSWRKEAYNSYLPELQLPSYGWVACWSSTKSLHQAH